MSKVVVGGTFDSLHKGHKHLLKEADSLGGIKIGLTSNEMAKKMKGVDVEDYKIRQKNILDNFPNAEVEKIKDPSGFSIEEDFDYIVVSSETRERAEKINEKRKELEKEEIKIVEVNYVLAEDGEQISSSRIRNGEIDKEGNLLSK